MGFEREIKCWIQNAALAEAGSTADKLIYIPTFYFMSYKKNIS